MIDTQLSTLARLIRFCEPTALAAGSTHHDGSLPAASAVGSDSFRLTGQNLLWLTLVGCNLLLWCTPTTSADDKTPQPSRELKLADLPPIPDDLKPLVTANELTFKIGGPRPSLLDNTRSTGSSTRRFDAETQFRLKYTFGSRCEWKTVSSPGSPNSIKQLAVKVRFDRIRISVKHQIWLKEMPKLDEFWDSPLVRHEFDHVRISSDPRLAEVFRKAVMKHQSIELSRAESEPLIALAYRQWNASWFGRGTLLNYLKNDDAKRWVKKAVQGEFDQLVELVEVRYAELDRVTEHGRRPVPDGGPLRDWLRR